MLVGGKRRSKPFLDLRGDVTFGGEQGLLSMAFAPDYAKTGRFYVNFTDRNGDTRVQEFQRSKGNPDRANRASRRAILFVIQPYPNHNGGLVLFGPDGYLYVGMGDGGAGGDPENRAQNLDSLLGKMLRIDPRPGAALSPPSNPFVGRAGRDEIYSYGLRNPWRFSFDRKTGDIHIGDVGQNAREEIDYAPRGGAQLRLELLRGQAPVRQLAHVRQRDAACARLRPGRWRMFGYRRHGRARSSGPGLAGRYIYGDYCTGVIRSFRIVNGKATGDRRTGLDVPELSSFGEDARGRVYAVSLNGPVYRLRSR